MSDMLDDINKFAKIWDAAQEAGIFGAPESKVNPNEEEGWGSDFFGQNFGANDGEEMFIESEVSYWAECSRISDFTGKKLNEAKAENSSGDKKLANKMGDAHNPVYPNSLGKDQKMNVSQNWGVGGKEHFDLEQLKIDLEKLESKLNALDAEGKSSNSVQSKIDDIKKQIDELSDSLSGDRSKESEND